MQKPQMADDYLQALVGLKAQAHPVVLFGAKYAANLVIAALHNLGVTVAACIARHNNPTVYGDKYFECTFAAVCSGLAPELTQQSDYVSLSDTADLRARLCAQIAQTKPPHACGYCRFESDPSAVVKRAVQYVKGDLL